MSNAVTPLFGNSPAVSSKDLASRLAESAQNDPRGGAADGLYLNFSGKRGIYSIGPENRQIKPDEEWVVNIASFEDGWVCWKGGRPAATRMSNIYTGVPVPAPDPEEFGPFSSRDGEGWFQAKSLVLKSLDTDEQGYFKINSKSGVSAIAGLQREIVERSHSGLACWPIVSLDNEEFKAQGFTNFKPVFKVSGWLNDECVMKLAEDDYDLEELIKQSEGPAQVSGPDDDDEDEDDEPPAAPVTEPTRRRRRTAL